MSRNTNTFSNPVTKLKEDLEKHNDTDFPYHVFPEKIRTRLDEMNKRKGFVKQFTYASFMYTSTACIGNSTILFNGEYDVKCSMFLVCVANAGVGKSHPFNLLTQGYLMKVNNQYKKELEERATEIISKYEESESNKPNKTLEKELEKNLLTREFALVQDSTIQALTGVLCNSPRGLAVYIDEIRILFDSFTANTNGASSVEANHISILDGNSNVLIRDKGRYTEDLVNPIASYGGTIQPETLKNVLSTMSKDSGFLERMLFINGSEVKRAEKRMFNRGDVKRESLDNSVSEITMYFDQLRSVSMGTELQVTNESGDAFAEYVNRDTEKVNDLAYAMNPILASMYAKKEKHVQLFALLINRWDNACGMLTEDDTRVTLDQFNRAIILCEYFFKASIKQRLELKHLSETDSFEKWQRMVLETASKGVFTVVELHESLGGLKDAVSIQTVKRWLDSNESPVIQGNKKGRAYTYIIKPKPVD